MLDTYGDRPLPSGYAAFRKYFSSEVPQHTHQQIPLP